MTHRAGRFMRAAGHAVAGMLVTGLAVSGCGLGGPAGPHPSVSARRPATPTPPPAPPRAPGQLLRVGDLPAGFIARPLDRRNLPSQLTGCPRLEGLVASGTGVHRQAEFFRLPVGPWVDEALITPAGATATQLAGKLTRALAGCDSVTVTEEGHRVRLALAPAPDRPAGGESRAYRATGAWHGIPLAMDVVLAPAGGLVLLLTTTAVGGPADPALTANVLGAAVRRATTG
jgi:hypothetical protein